MQNSPVPHKITTSKRTEHWRRASVDDIDVDVPWNAPVEVLKAVNRRLTFGEVEGGDGWRW